MKHAQVLGGILAASVAALMLAGCASPVKPHSTKPAPSVTASPTPTTASQPGSRVPLGCADVFAISGMTTLVGASPTIARDENSAPQNLSAAAQLQYGALDCEEELADGSTSGSVLDVSIAPDAASQFAASFPKIMSDQALIQHPAATQNVAGDQSGYWCANQLDALGADFNLPVCDAEMLVGSYWASMQLSNVTGLTRAQITGALTSVLTDLAKKLAAAPAPVGQWQAPASTPPALCVTGNTPAVRAAIGLPNVVLDTSYRSADAASTIGQAGVYASCRWDTPSSSGIDFELLAGGSWALNTLKPEPIGDSGISGPYLPLSVSGASSALEACGQGECDAYLAVGTSAVNINYNDPGAAKRSAELAALVKIIATS